jgi:hypothetical protein
VVSRHVIATVEGSWVRRSRFMGYMIRRAWDGRAVYHHLPREETWRIRELRCFAFFLILVFSAGCVIIQPLSVSADEIFGISVISQSVEVIKLSKSVSS